MVSLIIYKYTTSMLYCYSLTNDTTVKAEFVVRILTYPYFFKQYLYAVHFHAYPFLFFFLLRVPSGEMNR